MYFITDTGDKNIEMVREDNIVLSDLIVANIFQFHINDPALLVC